MGEKLFDITINISVSIPLFADESIMLLDPPPGFIYRKILLDDYEYRNKLKDGDGEIGYDFQYAIKTKGNEQHVLVLEREEIRTVKYTKPANSCTFIRDHHIDNLISPIESEFNQILYYYFSMLHVFKEGDVDVKYTFYKFTTCEAACKNREFHTHICMDANTLITCPMIIQRSEVDSINHFLFSHRNAFDILKNVVVSDIEYTYHILDEATNFKNLMTALEVMFLKNEYRGKKKILAKRIATFIGNSEEEIHDINIKVNYFYECRNDAVHEGKTDHITVDVLNDLRCLVRRVIKKYIDFIEKYDVPVTFTTIRHELLCTLKTMVPKKHS